MLDLKKLTASLAIKPSAQGRHLVRAQTGEPFFWRADTAWELCHRLTKDQSLEYLDQRKEQGFNAVLTVVFSECEGLDAPNREGEYLLKPDSNGLRRDPTRLNEAYFEHIDWVVQQAADRGITIVLVPSWGAYINGGWTGQMDKLIFNEENARIVGQYIGERYPGLPKILGGDTNRFWLDASKVWAAYSQGKVCDITNIQKSDCGAVINAMAEGIVRGERESAGIDAFLTFHPTAMWLPDYPPATAASYFGDRPWLSMDACQSGHADFRTVQTDPLLNWWVTTDPTYGIEMMYEASTRTTVRPVIDLEPHYEGMRNGLMGDDPRIFGPADIRNGTYASVFSGACGFVYGANSVWQMYQASLGVNARCGLAADADYAQDVKNFQGPRQLMPLTQLMHDLPASAYEARVPAQDLLLSGPTRGEARVSVTRDLYDDGRPSTFVWAYSGKGEAFELDVSCLGAPPASSQLRAEWMKPSDGSRRKVGTAISTTKMRFEPPSSGTLDDDWVLLLSSEP